MAKETTDGLLIGILKELQELSVETKKLNRTSGKSNVPGNAGIMSSSNIKNLDAFGNSLQIISSAIIPLSKLSAKNIEDVGNNIKLLSIVLSGIKFSDANLKSIKNMMSAITSINQVFDGITDNFFKSFLKFSPIRAKILGKRMAEFYKILFEQFEKEKFSDLLKNFGGEKDKHVSEKLTGFSKIIDSIMKIDPKNLLKLGLVLKRFPSEGGKNFADFFKPILQIINELPDNITNTKKTGILKLGGSPETSVEVNPKVGAFINIVQLITSITAGQIAKLVLMSNVLNEKGGENIGKFFAGIINAILKNDEKGKRAETASKIIKSMTFLLMTLTISVVALTVLIAAVGFGKVVLGFITLGAVVGLAYGIMRLLSSDKFQESSKSSMYGALGIAALIGTLTISLLLLVAVAKQPFEQIVKGLVLFTGLIGATWLIMKILSSNSFKESSKESLISVGAIVLLLIGISLAMLITISVGKHASEILKGVLLVTAFAVGGVYLIKFLAKLNKATILQGLIGTAAVTLMITGISAAMLVFGKFLKNLNGVTNKTIAWGIGLTVAMIAGMIGLAHLLSPLAIDPLFWAGFGMVETIAIMIASISGAMLLFTNLLKEIKNLSKDDIKDTVDKLIMKGGMIDALRSIIDALDDFGIKSSIKVAAIGKAIQPVISSISQFVDVIQKMASMKIADEWDKNGKPTHYMRLQPAEFKKAADNLSMAFSVFVTELGIAFSTIDKKARKNMKKLSGPISKIISGVASLIGPLMQIASGKMQVGNEVVSVDLNKILEASNGIVNVISSMFGPLNELAGRDINHMKIKKLFGTFRKSMQQLIKLLAYTNEVKIPIDDSILNKLDFLTHGGDIIIKFLNQNFEDAYTNAKIFRKALNPFRESVKSLFDLFKYSMEIGIPIDNSYIQTITTLRTGLFKILALLQLTEYLKIAKKNSKTFIDIFSNFVKGYKTLIKTVKFEKLNKTFIKQTTNLVEGLSNIVGFLTNLDNGIVTTTKRGLFGRVKTQSVSKLIHNSQIFKEAMKNTAVGINHIKPFLSATPKQITDLANALKQLDVELLQKDQERTKAMQSISTNFKDMSTAINKLNISMAKSLDISKAFDVTKTLSLGNIVKAGANIVSTATNKVKDTVSDIFNPNKKEEEQKVLEEQKQKDYQALANAISVAVSAALDAWAESHKDLTVQFNDSSEKIFGEVYHN